MDFVKWATRAVAAFLLTLLLHFNISLYTADAGSRAARVDALEELTAELDAGAGEEMQMLFPEGYTITHGLVGFGWVDAALDAGEGTPEQEHALDQARKMATRFASEKGREIFSPAISPPYGAFYRGYLGWLRGGILFADPTDDPKEVAAFKADCEEIAAAFREAETPYLDSYRDMAWPADSVFLAATLALHDKLFEPKYETDLMRWKRMVRERFHPELGLIPHSAIPGTGDILQPPRGVSSVVMSRMLWEIDPKLATDQWQKTRKHFVVGRFGILAGVREYPIGTEGAGDVDSGPLFFGLSASASVVAVAAAKLQADHAYAEPAQQFLHAIGMPMFDRYGFGWLPVGEAFFAWTQSTRAWAGPPPPTAAYEPVVVSGWRLGWHALSLLLTVLVIGLVWLFEKAIAGREVVLEE